jgi:hypothetical protein
MNPFFLSVKSHRAVIESLRKRFQAEQNDLSVKLQALAEERSNTEANENRELAELADQLKANDDSLVTSWDDELEKIAEAADRKVLQSLEVQKEKLLKLDNELKSRQVFFKQQYEQAVIDADAEYKKHKDDPRHEYERTIQQLQVTAKPSAQAVVDARELAKYRGIPIHHEKPNEKFDHISNLREATEHLGVLHSNLHREVDLLRYHPIAKVNETFWFWVLSAAIGLMAGLVVFLLKLPILYTAIAAAVGFVVAVIVLKIVLGGPLKTLTGKHYPVVEVLWADCQQTVQTAEQFARQLAEQKLKELQEKCATTKIQAEQHYKENSENLEKRISKEKKEIIENLTDFRSKVQLEFEQRSGQSSQQNQVKHELLKKSNFEAYGARDALKRRRLAEIDVTTERWKERSKFRVSRGIQSANNISRATQAAVAENYPSWDATSWEHARWERPTIEPSWCLGYLKYKHPKLLSDAKNRESVADSSDSTKSFQHEAAEESSSLRFPVCYRPLEHNGLLLRSDSKQGETSKRVLSNVIMRAITSLPPGKVFLTLIDPRGLGRDFSWLMHLGDYDPRLVQHRVWTEPVHIAHHLGELVRHSEQVIQQLLRDRYRNLFQYNQEAGSLSEPYHLIVWPDFPFGCDETSWKNLVSLLQAGPRCGVAICLQCDESLHWPTFMERSALEHSGIKLNVNEDGTVVLLEPNLESLEFEPELPPDEVLKSRLIRSCGTAAVEAGKVELPMKQLLGDRFQMWQEKTAKVLEVPLGQSGPGRVIPMRLGIGTNQHVLIAGKTGSGKSTLLHTLITSAALRYSPIELRFVLLDFKKGVEFQIYAESGLPHADIIGIESQREFGLSALEYVDSCLQMRGELFREAGVQDLGGWSEVNPGRHMPRILVVIDEFQELFVQDDKIAQQAGLFLDRIVRQGRSFGVHAILASQTLAGAYSLPRTTLGQMGVRIALQCDEADAAVILSDDNLAAARLSYAGQAIYNNAGGRIEGNQPLQIAWVGTSEQREWIKQMHPCPINNDPTTNRLEKTIVFEGHKPAVWTTADIDKTTEALLKHLGRQGETILLGEAVAIRPAIGFQRTSQPGRNVLMVGNDSRLASRLTELAIRSQARAAEKMGRPAVQWKVLNGGRPNDAGSDQFIEGLKKYSPQIEVHDARSVEQVVRDLAATIEQRQGTESENWDIIWLMVWQLDRFRSLKRSEEFSFGSDDDQNLEKAFSKIVRDGPSVGIHAWIWADSVSTASRWLSRNTMNDCEVRLLMQMSAADSNQLVDSNMAAHLGNQLALLYDHGSGLLEKIRPVLLKE